MFVLFNCLREYEYVVQVYVEEFPDHISKDGSHQPLEGCWRVTIAFVRGTSRFHLPMLFREPTHIRRTSDSRTVRLIYFIIYRLISYIVIYHAISYFTTYQPILLFSGVPSVNPPPLYIYSHLPGEFPILFSLDFLSGEVLYYVVVGLCIHFGLPVRFCEPSPSSDASADFRLSEVPVSRQ